MFAIYRCVAALDVHQSKLTVCELYSYKAGDIIKELMKEFAGFKKDRMTMAEWAASFKTNLAAMESTGINWMSPYAALEKHDLKIEVVNTRLVKQALG